ncbi:MAG: DUF1294 domain-containing protein [Lachnospiraceae bacterium]|nr:DUF1294 domain-containing protein [Lachnospiraceae bacterium]
MTKISYLYFAICLCFIVINFAAFFLYSHNPYPSQRRNGNRVSEGVLLALAFLGGGIGAFLGMRCFWKKKVKLKFSILVPLAAVLWVVLFVRSLYFVAALADRQNQEVNYRIESVSSNGESEEASFDSTGNDAVSAAMAAARDSLASVPEPVAEWDIREVPAGTIVSPARINWEKTDQYFRAYEIELGDEVYKRIIGKSYRENEDIALSDLLYLKMLHYNFDAEIQMGEMIVNRAIAEDVIAIFYELFQKRYQICSMYLIDNYWTGDGVESDEASIEEDNTSCFNYRRATNAENLSNHAFGRAIDINPRENPFILIREDGSYEYYHENAAPYITDRTAYTPHVITQADLAYKVFTKYGFSWGGEWSNPLDYQHFEKLE